MNGIVLDYAAKCSGTSPYGKYLGVKTNQGGYYWIRPTGRAYLTMYGGYECIDPPHYKDTPRDCAATVGATLVGPTRNPDVASKTTMFPRAKSRFARSGYKNLSLCDDDFVQPYPVVRNTLGRYKLTSDGTQVTCTVRQYTTPNARTGRTPASYIRRCGGQFPYMTQEIKWQLWCGGWGFGWNNKHTFTQNECKDKGDWSCGPNVNKVPRYGGTSVPAAGIGVIDSGEKLKAVWDVPKPSGKALTNAGARRVALQLDEHSTPLRKDKAVNGETQPFMVSPKLNTALDGWGKKWNIWQIGFQAPSLPASADGKIKNQWVAIPTWLFTADFKTITLTSVTVDWRTGKVTPVLDTVPVNAPATCVGQPLSLSVYRARNST